VSAHGCRAFVVDPVSVDERPPVARVPGCPELPRFSFVHALNIRACGRRLAGKLAKPFAELDAVVAHLGAGISIAALKQGRIPSAMTWRFRQKRPRRSASRPRRWPAEPI
jgi:butyrate kinase